MRPGIPSFTTLKLNSYYFEVGERSFLKESLAYQVSGQGCRCLQPLWQLCAFSFILYR
jgi:hypothetical protein